jgi:thiamine biosynthesis lipoprotein
MQIRLLIPAVLLALLSACSQPEIQKFEGFAQGTTYHISYWSKTPVDQQAVVKAVQDEFSRIDLLLSNYRPDSTIETFNHNETLEPQKVGGDIVTLVKIARKVHEASAGCYDLTIKPLFDLWGFKGETLNIPNEKTLQKTLKQIGMSKLKTVDDQHLQKQQIDLKIDLSSIAQGYSVEKISQVLEQQGIHDYLVEIGGELKTQGHKPDASAWRIAVERPLPDQQKLQKIINLPKDMPMAVMTSGTYRHYFDRDGKRYSHILDARTGRPVEHQVVSVTVMHIDPILADAWSTTLLCLGLKDGLETANRENIAAFFIEQQGETFNESYSQSFNTASLSAIQ